MISQQFMPDSKEWDYRKRPFGMPGQRGSERREEVRVCDLLSGAFDVSISSVSVNVPNVTFSRIADG